MQPTNLFINNLVVNWSINKPIDPRTGHLFNPITYQTINQTINQPANNTKNLEYGQTILRQQLNTDKVEEMQVKSKGITTADTAKTKALLFHCSSITIQEKFK